MGLIDRVKSLFRPKKSKEKELIEPIGFIDVNKLTLANCNGAYVIDYNGRSGHVFNDPQMRSYWVLFTNSSENSKLVMSYDYNWLFSKFKPVTYEYWDWVGDIYSINEFNRHYTVLEYNN